MQSLLLGGTALSLRRNFPRRLLAKSHVCSSCLSEPVTDATHHPLRAKPLLRAALRVPSAAFSTNNYNAQSSPEQKPLKKKRGIIAKIRHFIATAFGYNDHTPRGIQERKDMYLIVLAVALRHLRMENQSKLLLNSNKKHFLTDVNTQPSPLVWREESNEQLKDMMDEVASHLDDETDIHELSLLRLRTEIQTFLKPQIVNLLALACDVEEEMLKRHGVVDEDNKEYEFSENEEKEYKQILLHEYNKYCQLIKKRNTPQGCDKHGRQWTPDPVPYYELRKGAIETLLTFFDWWPEDASAPIKSADADAKDYVDEFGFSPNMADAEILHAMRYYHVRNLVRSSLVQRAPVTTDISCHNEEDNKPSSCYHSLLTFKSTIPSAGRGVFIDGYAPAGTLIAFFPGKIWPKEHLKSASIQTQMELSANNPRDQLSMRHDDILIDSRHSPYTVVKNLWALGHIVNHPAAPTVINHPPRDDTPQKENSEGNYDKKHYPRQGPNCGTVPINFTDQMLKERPEFGDYIPNEYELLPKSWAKNTLDKDEIIMHGLGLFVLRDVKDEELFYDYRMSPGTDATEGGSGYPSWYYVWDQEAISNRWDNDE